MKILVTGGTGKVGQWVVREGLGGDSGKSGHEVIVLDRVPGSRIAWCQIFDRRCSRSWASV